LKLNIDESLLKKLMMVAIIIVLAKGLNVLLAFFLPITGIESALTNESAMYEKFKVQSAMHMQTPQKAFTQEAPTYRLDNIELQGLYASAATPFIMVKEGQDAVIIVLNEVFRGYKLTQVNPDYAIMSKSGKNYELRFKEDAEAPKAITKAETVQVSDKAVFVKRNEIKYFTKNYKKIWDNIKIDEVVKDKHLEGFKVKTIKKNSIFSKIGLKEGDIITAVNNKELKSISQVFKLYNNIDKLDSIKITLKRGNETKELEYEIF
jgi:general secretion pathway protein C